MSPYPGLDQPISLQSWGHQLKLSDAERPADRPVHRSRCAATSTSTPSRARAATRSGRASFDQDNPPPFAPAPPVSAVNNTTVMPEVIARAQGVTPDPVSDRAGLPAVGARGSHGNPRWVRPFVIAAAALVLLLVGAAGGLLIGRAGVPEVPAADSVDVGFLQDMTVHHAAGRRDGVLGAASTRPTPSCGSWPPTSRAPRRARSAGCRAGWSCGGRRRSRSAGSTWRGWRVRRPGRTSTPSPRSGVATMPGMASSDELKRLRGVHRQGPRRAVPAADAPPPRGRRGDAELRGDERVAGARCATWPRRCSPRRRRRRAT